MRNLCIGELGTMSIFDKGDLIMYCIMCGSEAINWNQRSFKMMVDNMYSANLRAEIKDLEEMIVKLKLILMENDNHAHS